MEGAGASLHRPQINLLRAQRAVEVGCSILTTWGGDCPKERAEIPATSQRRISLYGSREAQRAAVEEVALDLAEEVASRILSSEPEVGMNPFKISGWLACSMQFEGSRQWSRLGQYRHDDHMTTRRPKPPRRAPSRRSIGHILGYCGHRT